MVGDGRIALSAVDHLLAIGRVSAPLLDAVIAYLADGNAWVADRLAREPGWVLDSALRGRDNDVFAEHLGHVNSHQLRGAQARQEGRWQARTRQSARPATGPLQPQLEDARAYPVIVGRRLYREVCEQAFARPVAELKDKLARREAERKAARQTVRGARGHRGRPRTRCGA